MVEQLFEVLQRGNVLELVAIDERLYHRERVLDAEVSVTRTAHSTVEPLSQMHHLTGVRQRRLEDGAVDEVRWDSRLWRFGFHQRREHRLFGRHLLRLRLFVGRLLVLLVLHLIQVVNSA